MSTKECVFLALLCVAAAGLGLLLLFREKGQGNAASVRYGRGAALLLLLLGAVGLVGTAVRWLRRVYGWTDWPAPRTGLGKADAVRRAPLSPLDPPSSAKPAAVVVEASAEARAEVLDAVREKAEERQRAASTEAAKARTREELEQQALDTFNKRRQQ